MIDEQYKVTKELGQGGSSKVFLAEDNLSNKYAIKILRKDKKYSYRRGAAMLKREHCIMDKLQGHPNILNSLYCNPDGVMKNGSRSEPVQYNLLELAENGALSKYVRITGSIEEEIVRFMALQLVDGLRHLHQNGFVHLDLKLENILLDKYYNIKLADLGVAFELGINNTRCCHRRGTLHYMAPEVMDLQKNQDFDGVKADMYSLGVCLYILMVGDFPDQSLLEGSSLSTGDSDFASSNDIEMNDDKNSTKNWSCLSENAKNLLLSLLSPNPESRPTIEDVLSHPWFDGINFEEVLANLYSEMSYRKKFITSFPTRKTNTNKHIFKC